MRDGETLVTTAFSQELRTQWELAHDQLTVALRMDDAHLAEVATARLEQLSELAAHHGEALGE